MLWLPLRWLYLLCPKIMRRRIDRHRHMWAPKQGRLAAQYQPRRGKGQPHTAVRRKFVVRPILLPSNYIEDTLAPQEDFQLEVTRKEPE